MPKFKCWSMELGETENDVVAHFSDNPELAAETYVRVYERRAGEYPVAKGNDSMTIHVRRLDDGVLFEVLVGGFAVPTYNGRIIKGPDNA